MNGFFKTLSAIFHIHPKVCVVNESKSEIREAIGIAERFDFDAEGYTDYKKLLFDLHSSSMKHIRLVIIHENGNKSKPNMLTTFIHQLNPEVPVITYKTHDELASQLQAIC